MGKHFGNLATIRGVKYYQISQYEQCAYGQNALNGIPNWGRRFRSSWYWVPPMFLGYAVYRYIDWSNWCSHRKNPREYANEIAPPPEPEPEPEEDEKCPPKK